MANIVKFISNISRVAYDKGTDYFLYYTTSDNLNNINNINDLDNVNNEDDINNISNEDSLNNEDNLNNYELQDSIYDFSDKLNVTTYTDETQNKRILPEIGIIEQYSIFFDNPTHIIDNIYLGSAYNAASYDTLISNNIKVIFNITNEISNYFPDEFIYIQCKLYDNNKESIIKHAHKAFKEIIHHQENTEGNIFIHCYMGKSRSAAIVLYYIMKTKNYTFDEALNFIRSKRHIVNPTFRFTKDLANF
jgi:predicted protein tyrosine phosphatase